MPAPTNIDAAHATELGPTLPNSVTQDTNFGGVTYTLWFKYTAPSATVYYFKCESSTGNVGTALLTISVALAPAVGTPTGSFFISDDKDGFPGAIISATNGVGILNFINPFPTGEQADIIPVSGIFLHSDDTNNAVKLYDKDFTLLATIATGSHAIRYNTTLGRFYVSTITLPVSVRVINSVGATTSTIGPLAAGVDPHALSPNNAGTILYYADKNLTRAIKAWNITGNAALPDFLVAKVGYRVIDILTLVDDTLLIFYGNNARDRVVYRYDSTGALLNTYSFGTDSAPILGRLAYAIDDPNSFLIWTHPGNVDPTKLGLSRFTYIKVSDGSTIGMPVEVSDFEEGIYSPARTLTPIARFGTSPSCPVIVLRNDTIPVFKSVLSEFSVGQDLVTYLPTNTVFSPNGTTEYLNLSSTDSPMEIPLDSLPGALVTGILAIQKITNPPDDTKEFTLTTNAVHSIVPKEATPSIKLNRSAALPSIAAVTFMGWWKLPTTDLAPGDQYSFMGLFQDDDLFVLPYFFLGTNNDSTVLQFDYGDGVTDNITTGSTLPKNEWFHLALVVSGLNIKVYLNGVLDISVVVAGAPVLNFIYAFIDADLGVVHAANLKIWSRALSANDIRLERWSTVVTNSLNIYLSTPFLTLVDYLKDHSGLNHHWTLKTGTPALDVGYTTFILRSHEFQAFLVPIGSGYSIIETPLSGYALTYVVSNDSLDNNLSITVGKDDPVIITVNNAVSTGFGGLYYIHPNKINDTVWLSITGSPPTTVTEDLKIPDPFADTSFIGG